MRFALLVVAVLCSAVASAAPPFGSFDTPANNSTGLQGALAITGWALDDVGVTKVEVWRDPMIGDDPASIRWTPDVQIQAVFVGIATIVSGARPDVEALYPSFPNADRAAWGYMLLTNLLPNTSTGAPAGGFGWVALNIYVFDVEGNVKWLPVHQFQCDNVTSPDKPFGTIDTPAQGATVSGIINNFGWALTPNPANIDTDGHTITLFIDNALQGTATYGGFRQDIVDLFPGYANTTTAIGLFSIDTTTLTNGVHTIAWSVRDSMGRADGIGSRYFTVAN